MVFDLLEVTGTGDDRTNGETRMSCREWRRRRLRRGSFNWRKW
jgi:hypothetical protein